MFQRAISEDFAVLYVPPVRMPFASFTTMDSSMKPPWKPHPCTGPSLWTTSPHSAPARPPAPTTPTPASGLCPTLYMSRMALCLPAGSWTSAYTQCPKQSGFSSSKTTFTDTMMGTERHLVCMPVWRGSTFLLVWRPCRSSLTMWQTSLTPTLSHTHRCWTGSATPLL